MWNDEDNNPYGSFDRRGSTASEDGQAGTSESYRESDLTPTSDRSSLHRDSGDYHSETRKHEQEGDDRVATTTSDTRKKSYHSRVEQIILEQEDLVITITHAGKNTEGGGSYIAYTIRTGDLEVRRRYSDFYSLRIALVQLHPTLIIPPIPEKHTMADYAAKPTKAKEDEAIIDYRKRMLTSFLNRCRRMEDVRRDTVFTRFLDPNASWSEVLHSPPVSSLPKNNLKAPPLDPANPTPGHQFLVVPSSTAKLKSSKDSSMSSSSGTPSTPPAYATSASSAAHTIPGQQVFGRFPPTTQNFSEHDLDPYFANYETLSRELETLLQGSMEKVNKRTLSHLSSFAEDLAELGARFNGFSLSEQSASLAAAIEKTGQAVDSTYIATVDLSSSLSASFSEPMRESAQFAGIVRNVLRYRILKRVQEEMTREELDRKRISLESLEKSEMEAQRIERHLESSGYGASSFPRQSTSSSRNSQDKPRNDEDIASIDSDFPPAHSDSRSQPSAAQGDPGRHEPSSPPITPKKSSGNFVTNKIFGRINHAIHGIVDVDPERTRRDQIGKTKESIVQLEQALDVSEKDVKDASAGVLRSLKEFQGEKEADLKKYMIAYARCHMDWAKRNLASWEEAKAEIDHIDGCLRGQLAAITSSASKKRRLTTYGRRRGSWDRQDHELFTAHDTSSDLKSPTASQPHSPPQNQASSTSGVREISSDIEVEQLQAPVRATLEIPRYPRLEVAGETSTHDLARQQSEETIVGRSEAEPVNGHVPEVNSNKHPYFVKAVDMRSRFGFGRAASPSKRSASERDDENTTIQEAIDERGMQTEVSTPATSLETPIPDRSKVASVAGMPAQARPLQLSADAGTSDDIVSPPPARTNSGGVTRSCPTQFDIDSGETFSFDEQVQTVKDLIAKHDLKEGLPGYLVAKQWFIRVISRTSDGLRDGTLSKAARDGSVGPVDNSVIADLSQPDLKDADGKQFIPLKPGLRLYDDFEIVPFEAWTKIIRWYGKAKASTEIIRIVHNTAENEASSDNLLYELYPPVLMIQKLHIGSDFSMSALANKIQPAVQLVASRSEMYQKFIVRIKKALKINDSVKIRIWKVSTVQLAGRSHDMSASTIPTPTSSRSNSPALPPNVVKSKPKLVVDLLTFNDMTEGSERELVDLRDETTNQKYNGHANVGMAGFSEYQAIIVEEQGRGDLFTSEASIALPKHHSFGLPTSVANSQASNVPKSNARPIDSSREPAQPGTKINSRFHKNGRSKGSVGLQNLGNTCYMNSALQCIRSVEELTLYFLQQNFREEINGDNPLGYRGQVAKSYATFVDSVYHDVSSFAPREFKGTLGRVQPLFSGYGQQDSQEFLSFLVDALHEDLNRVHKKPYRENPDSDDKTVHDPEAILRLGQIYRENHRARNDSVIMDLFSGFYKNTMVCPVCAKVSITFDPYSSVTLQLPVETPWSHTITIWPLSGKPLFMDVELDKASNVRTLKGFVVKRLPNLKADTLVLAEIFNNKLYKIFQDGDGLSEATIQSNDKLDLFELDGNPTNWISETKRSGFSAIRSGSVDEPPTMASPQADCMAVPVYHRLRENNRTSLRLWPTLITISRDEVKDFDTILRKVLHKVNTMTTYDLFEMRKTGRAENDRISKPDSSPAHDSDDAKVQARSVEGEDGLVDISMIGTSTTNQRPSVRINHVADDDDIIDADTFLDPGLRNLFDMCYFQAPSETFPCGYSGFQDQTRYQTIWSRVQHAEARSPRSMATSTSSSNIPEQNSAASSDDELSRDPRQLDQDSDSDHVMGNLFSAGVRSGLARVRNSLQRSKRNKDKSAKSEAEYLLKLREGIVLDWHDQAFETLFGGDENDNMRGQPLSGRREIQTFYDNELETKRSRRTQRKNAGVSLMECLEETAKSEILSEENAWYCGRCKELRRATKTLELWTTPDILVLHLKRFSSQSRLRDKVDVVVDFPVDGLDLTGRVGMPEGKSQIYDLFAVDNHYGGLGGGHYTAYAQNFYDRKWYDYNDSSVSEVRAPSNVVTRAAYLLFYRRRSERPLGPSYVADIVDEAYRPSDADSSLGEGQRGNDSTYPSGSLSASPLHSVSNATARSLRFNETGGNISPSGDNAADLDEGVDVAGPDDPLPSYEIGQAVSGTYVRENMRHQEWSFARVDAERKGASDEESMTAASDVAAPPDSDNEESLQPLADDRDFELRRGYASRSSMVSDASMPDSEPHERMRTVEVSYDEEQAEDPVMEIRTGEDM